MIWLIPVLVGAAMAAIITVDSIRKAVIRYLTRLFNSSNCNNWSGLKVWVLRKKRDAIDVGIFDQDANVVENCLEMRYDPGTEVQVQEGDVILL